LAYCSKIVGTALAAFVFLPSTALAGKLNVSPEAREGLRLIYSGEPDRAINVFRKTQQEHPEHPLGYLLEADARWWKFYCEACELRWGMIDAWKRGKVPEDEAYLALLDRAIQLGQASLAQSESAEMHFYLGMAWALKARLLALREERMGTARAGVKARAQLLRALQLDPDLFDAYVGLGIYNYYVDALSPVVKMLKFLMGIPGGSKKEGVRQLEQATERADLTREEARFYLAKCLRNYEHNYARAVSVMQPLVEQYPRNPLFRLLLGDMNAKLRRSDQATSNFRAAQSMPVEDSRCAARIRQVAQAALDALGTPTVGSAAQ